MKSNNKSFLIFIVTLFLYGIAAGGVHPVTPTMIIERGLTSSMFGVAFAAMQFTMFTFSPFFGKLANYVPTRKILLWGGLGYTIAQIVFMFAYTDAMIIIARLLAGIACGAMMTAFPNYVMNTAPDSETRQRRITIYQTTFNVATAVGYFTGGMLGLISVEAACLAQVIILAVTAVAFVFICEDDTPYKSKPERALSFKDANPFGAFFDLRRFISTTLILLFSLIAFTALAQFAYEQVFNYYIKDIFGLTSAYNGIFKAVIAILSLTLNSTVCLYLIKKTDINNTILPTVICGLVPLGLALIFSESVLPFASMYIIFSVITIVRLPMLQNLCALNATPETRNNITGFYQAMTSLGAIIGAFVAGVIYPFNPMSPFIMAFAAFLIGTLFTIAFTVRHKLQKKAG